MIEKRDLKQQKTGKYPGKLSENHYGFFTKLFAG